jgi:hypothetical protein
VIHAQITEGLIDDAATGMAKEKVERLKQKTADAKQQLEKLRDAQRRKRDLEKSNRHEPTANENKATRSRARLYSGTGRLLGWLHSEGNGKVTVYDAKGRLVARELGVPIPE